jgi:hypothetical protein
MSVAQNPPAEAFRPFSERTKRKLTIATLVTFGIALSLLFVSAKYHEYRIRWDVGITNSRFADSNGASAGSPETDVAVAELSPRDRNRLFSRFIWTPVNNYPWYEAAWTTDGKRPIYDGIPWYEDLSLGRDLYPVLSVAPPGTDAQGLFLHAWFTAHGFRYDLVFQKQRNLLWIVSDKPRGSI